MTHLICPYHRHRRKEAASRTVQRVPHKIVRPRFFPSGPPGEAQDLPRGRPPFRGLSTGAARAAAEEAAGSGAGMARAAGGGWGWMWGWGRAGATCGCGCGCGCRCRHGSGVGVAQVARVASRVGLARSAGGCRNWAGAWAGGGVECVITTAGSLGCHGCKRALVIGGQAQASEVWYERRRRLASEAGTRARRAGLRMW